MFFQTTRKREVDALIVFFCSILHLSKLVVPYEPLGNAAPFAKFVIIESGFVGNLVGNELGVVPGRDGLV